MFPIFIYNNMIVNGINITCKAQSCWTIDGWLLWYPIQEGCGRYWINIKGQIWNAKLKKMTTGKHDSWQCPVNIFGVNWPVYRWMADTFIDNPEGKSCVRHKNGDSTDDRLENLEWCTPQEHSRRHLEMNLNRDRRGRFSQGLIPTRNS